MSTRYALHPAYRMEEAYHRNLKERTGRDFASWVKLAKAKGPKDRKELLAWLKKEHGLSSNYAWWVASGEKGGAAAYDPEQLVEDLYSGKRAPLRPIHDALLDAGFALGEDVKACPCQTMVPLYRKYCFAEITPTTLTSVDLKLALGRDVEESGRLERLKAGMQDDRVTHRIRIGSPKEVDAEVRRWMKAAYAKGNEAQKRATADPKSVTMPPDLAKALKASAKARATYDACTPRMQADWIQWITSAAKPETRARRVETTIEKLAEGKKRAY
jgi:hypothetical protein